MGIFPPRDVFESFVELVLQFFVVSRQLRDLGFEVALVCRSWVHWPDSCALLFDRLEFAIDLVILAFEVVEIRNQSFQFLVLSMQTVALVSQFSIRNNELVFYGVIFSLQVCVLPEKRLVAPGLRVFALREAFTEVFS